MSGLAVRLSHHWCRSTPLYFIHRDSGKQLHLKRTRCQHHKTWITLGSCRAVIAEGLPILGTGGNSLILRAILRLGENRDTCYITIGCDINIESTGGIA